VQSHLNRSVFLNLPKRMQTS